MIVTAVLLSVFVECVDFDEWEGPPPECACVDLVNTPADEDDDQ